MYISIQTYELFIFYTFSAYSHDIASKIEHYLNLYKNNIRYFQIASWFPGFMPINRSLILNLKHQPPTEISIPCCLIIICLLICSTIINYIYQSQSFICTFNLMITLNSKCQEYMWHILLQAKDCINNLEIFLFEKNTNFNVTGSSTRKAISYVIFSFKFNVLFITDLIAK